MTDTDEAIRAVGRSRLRHDAEALKAFNRDVIEEFRANEGIVGGPFAGADVLLLTMTGARTGQPRVTPLEYLRIEGRLIIVGSYGGSPKTPAWVHNLRADPTVRVEIGTETQAMYAQELLAGERDALFAKVVQTAPRFGEYQTRTTRRLPLFELRTNRITWRGDIRTPR